MTEGGSAAKLFTRDEASRIAVDIAKLPGLLLGFESHGRETPTAPVSSIRIAVIYGAVIYLELP